MINTFYISKYQSRIDRIRDILLSKGYEEDNCSRYLYEIAMRGDRRRSVFINIVDSKIDYTGWDEHLINMGDYRAFKVIDLDNRGHKIKKLLDIVDMTT